MDVDNLDLTEVLEKSAERYYDKISPSPDLGWADVSPAMKHLFRETMLPLVTEVIATIKEMEGERKPSALTERPLPMWILGGSEQEVREYARRHEIDSREWRTAGSARGLEGARMHDVVLLPGFWQRRDSTEMHLRVRMNVTKTGGTIRSVSA